MSDFVETQHGRNHAVKVVDGVVVSYGSDPITGLREVISAFAPRMVWGQVYNDAEIIAGTGFTAEWADEDGSNPGAELITIRFDTPFDNPPTVLLTGNNNNPADVVGEYGVTQKSVAAAYFVAEGLEFDGTPGIGGFNFAAIETEPFV